MKKGIFIVLLLLINFSILSAQTESSVGKFSVIPRIGVAISNLTNNSISTFREGDGSVVLNSKAKAGFVGGLDAEYRVSENFALGLGAYYAQQGFRYPDYAVLDASADNANQVFHYTGIHDHHANLHYLNVPLYVKGYLIEGLAVMAGIQFGFYINSNEMYEATDVLKNKDGSMTYGKTTKYDFDTNYQKLECSIPVGLSYEYQNVILDARYHIGLSHVVDWSDSMKNKTITISVGYRFAL